MSEYIVEAKSRLELRELANWVRERLGLKNELWFPAIEVLDILSEELDDFSYEIVADDELPENVHADTDIITGHIRIKENVYERACNGEGRDRMTIVHEIAHYFLLRFFGFKLQRNYENKDIEAFRDPEWQAKCFAGELMIPYHLTNGKGINYAMVECGVSCDAASYQLKRYIDEVCRDE